MIGSQRSLLRHDATFAPPNSGSRHGSTSNTGARDLSYNPEHNDRVKHVERHHFFIRELVEDQRVVVPFVRTHANLADFFTKPLTGKNFFRLRNEIMNVSPDYRARASLARRHARRASARPHVPCAPPAAVRVW